MSGPDTAVALLGESTLVETPKSADALRVAVVGKTHLRSDTIQRGARHLIASVEDPADLSRRGPRLLIMLDVVIALLATAVAITRPDALSSATSTRLALTIAAGTLAWPLSLACFGGYRRPGIVSSGASFRPVFLAAAAIITPAALLTTWLHDGRLMPALAVGVPVVVVGGLGARTAYRHHLHRTRRRGAGHRRSILVGSPEGVQQLCIALEQNRDIPLSVAGVCVPATDTERAVDLGLPVVGDLNHAAAAAASLGCRTVVIADTEPTPADFVRRLAWSLEDQDTELVLFPGLTDFAQHRVRFETHSNLPLLQLEQPRFAGWNRHIKRATDLVLTCFGLLLAGPLLGAVALAIKIDDHGPVLFRQVRVGVDGRHFTMYKFRSMVVDAERRLAELVGQNEGAGPLFKLEDDPRVTRVGRLLRRFSLDELPQLINVLAGSMSLVGPRPHLQTEVDRYDPHVHRRLKVLPGLTGPWQVGGRSLLSWDETVRLDLGYVENWSLSLDLRILIKTVRAVLGRTGAF